jgi:hypothetical protein
VTNVQRSPEKVGFETSETVVVQQTQSGISIFVSHSLKSYQINCELRDCLIFLPGCSAYVLIILMLRIVHTRELSSKGLVNLSVSSNMPSLFHKTRLSIVEIA